MVKTMRDTYEMHPAPISEDSAQCGEHDYERFAHIEAETFIEQIRRELLPEPYGSKLFVKHCPHDVGSSGVTYYAQVGYRYSTENDEHMTYMFKLDDPGYMLTVWDKEARDKLQNSGYFTWRERCVQHREDAGYDT